MGRVRVSDSIRIKVKIAGNAKEAYDLIASRYGNSDERVRDDLLLQVKRLTMVDCTDVTDYLNKLRRFKSDLAGVDYKLTDGLYITALLEGLDGRKWVPFKEKWDTIRAKQLDADPNAAPSVDPLEDRRHHKATVQQRRKDERRNVRVTDKTKVGSVGPHRTKGQPRTARTGDRSHLKCDFCGFIGHIEKTY